MQSNNQQAVYSDDFLQTLSSVAGLLARSKDENAAQAGIVLREGVKKEKRLQQLPGKVR